MIFNLGHFHTSIRKIARSKGGCCIKAIAYQARDSLVDSQTQSSYNFSRKSDDVEFSKIYIPKGADSKFQNRQYLWEQVKLVEKRLDANEGFTIVVALPNELSHEKNIEIIDHLSAYFTDKKLAVDANYHTNDENNLHAHFQVTKREVGANGFWSDEGNRLNKAPDFLNKKVFYHDWRQHVAKTINRQLELEGSLNRVTEKSHQELDMKSMPIEKIANYHNQAQNDAHINGQIKEYNKAINALDPGVALHDLTRVTPIFTQANLNRYIYKISSNWKEYNYFKEQIQKHENIVPLGFDKGGRQVYTTQHFVDEIARFEHELVKLSRGHEAVTTWSGDRKHIKFHDCTSASRHMGELEIARHHIRKFEEKKGFRLSRDQAALCCAVSDLLLRQSDKLINISAPAGAGKTTVVQVMADMIKAEKKCSVIACAPTAIAADNLAQSIGVEQGFTIDRLLKDNLNAQAGSLKDVYIIADEASMIDDHKLFALVSLCNKTKARLALVGDKNQLRAINGNYFYQNICFSKNAYNISLDTIRRQAVKWQREATFDFYNGNTGEALRAYYGHDKIHFSEGRIKTLEKAFASWKQYSKDEDYRKCILIAQTNKDVDYLNHRAREHLKFWQLIGKEVEVEITIGYQADRARLGIDKPDTTQEAILSALDQRLNQPSRVETRMIGVGEEIRFTQNNKDLKVFNGQLALVKDITENKMTVALGPNRQETRKIQYQIKDFFGLVKNPARIIEIDLKKYNNFDYAYASTVHKAQGGTWDKAVVAVTSKMLDSNSAYVAMSRHRYECEMYVNQAAYRNDEVRYHEENRAQADSVWFPNNQDKYQAHLAHERLQASRITTFLKAVESNNENLYPHFIRENQAETLSRSLSQTFGLVQEKDIKLRDNECDDQRVLNKVFNNKELSSEIGTHQREKEKQKEKPEVYLQSMQDYFGLSLEGQRQDEMADDRGQGGRGQQSAVGYKDFLEYFKEESLDSKELSKMSLEDKISGLIKTNEDLKKLEVLKEVSSEQKLQKESHFDKFIEACRDGLKSAYEHSYNKVIEAVEIKEEKTRVANIEREKSRENDRDRGYCLSL